MKDVPNGRRRDPAEQPGFRPIYGNTIFGAPDSGAPRRAPFFSTKIRPEQKRKRHLARLRGEIAPWTGPIREPLYKNTREGQRESRREEYRNRPIIPPSRPDDPIIIGPSPEQREINLRRVLDRFAAADPPPRRYFPTPAERAEFARQISAPATQDFRITRGLFHGPKQHQPNVPVQAAAAEEEGAVGGEEKREEGAVGDEDSEEDETLQVLYVSLSIEEPTQAPIPTPPKPTEPTRQGRSRGRGLLMYSPESLRKSFRESLRERSKSRIAWIRRLAEQQEEN
ncbi:uncharacterized protein LOC123475944 [Daphnia magna]|uniref:uncharacterized protein LOC123475944 n=1 Tax=Daphnia magna TaxID=35525 RepID=UPI001E1BB120|nr:uncharacterized protein LOC123475944 [Daphnia magna]